MKTLKYILVAGCVLASSAALRAESSAQAWLENYYLNPQPAELGRSVKALSRDGYFERPGNTAIAIGFLATVFAKSPERVDAWLLELNGLPLEHHRLIAAALWQAGHPMGAELLRTLAQTSVIRDDIERLASQPSVAILDTPVLSPSSMNLQWGAFLASGNERHIIAVLDAMGNNQPALTAAARTALAQNAANHPRVMEICRAQLSREPEEVRSVIRAALNSADAAKPRT
jgi:hypothetical protein